MPIPVDENGHPIFALIPVDRYKRPLVEWKRFQERLPTIEQIEKWKQDFGARIAGWAMPTGLVTGIVALDFDDEIGRETLTKLNLKPNVETPSRSYHVWIHGPNHPVRTGAIDKRWPGMELKGDGGYVVVIGHNIRSTHKGRESTIIGDYTVLNGLPTELDELPEDLHDFVAQEKERDIAFSIARILAEAIEKAKDGRNNAGFWLACQLRDLGLSKSEASTYIIEHFFDALPRGSHEYTKKELQESLNSAYSKPSREKDSAPTLATQGFTLVNEFVSELWTDGKIGYATLPTRENIPIRSQRMRDITHRLVIENLKTTVSRATVDQSLDSISSMAMAGVTYDPSLRVAWDSGICYVDMVDSFYAIDSDGYHKVNEIPVKFVRYETMSRLPEPVNKGDWNLLKRYINIEEKDWPLIQASILAAFMPPKGARPIIAFLGVHGSGKSTSVSAIVNLCDPRPSIEGTRETFPKEKRDLSVIAIHNLVLAFDNESHISNQMSDALAMLSTGSQFSSRALYTNNELSTFSGKRLVFINSIGEIVTESDLLDRSIIIECPPLEEYFDESTLWENFGLDQPKILAAIFNSVSTGIRNLESVANSASSTRLIDFYRWVIACGIEGFDEAFRRNILRAPEIAINHSYIGSFIVGLTRNPNQSERARRRVDEAAEILGIENPEDYAWIGSFSMLHEFGSNASNEWYRTLMGTLNAYRRLKTDLRKVGIEVKEYQHLHQLWLSIRSIE